MLATCNVTKEGEDGSAVAVVVRGRYVNNLTIARGFGSGTPSQDMATGKCVDGGLGGFGSFFQTIS